MPNFQQNRNDLLKEIMESKTLIIHPIYYNPNLFMNPYNQNLSSHKIPQKAFANIIPIAKEFIEKVYEHPNYNPMNPQATLINDIISKRDDSKNFFLFEFISKATYGFKILPYIRDNLYQIYESFYPIYKTITKRKNILDVTPDEELETIVLNVVNKLYPIPSLTNNLFYANKFNYINVIEILRYIKEMNEKCDFNDQRAIIHLNERINNELEFNKKTIHQIVYLLFDFLSKYVIPNFVDNESNSLNNLLKYNGYFSDEVKIFTQKVMDIIEKRRNENIEKALKITAKRVEYLKNKYIRSIKDGTKITIQKTTYVASHPKPDVVLFKGKNMAIKIKCSEKEVDAQSIIISYDPSCW